MLQEQIYCRRGMDCMVIEKDIDKVFENSFNSVYAIGEIGINHNGDAELAKNYVEATGRIFCSKVSKRNPEVTTPDLQKEIPSETPGG